MKIESLLDSSTEVGTRLWLKAGEIKHDIDPPQDPRRSDFSVRFPTATASVRGTIFSVSYNGAEGTIAVTEGTVEVTPVNQALSSFLLTAGQSATVAANGAAAPHGPSVASVDPPAGTADLTEVIITGANFSPFAAENVVRFGGVAGTVLAASATEITARVPAGLPTGTVPLSVSRNGAMSNATDFEVTGAHGGTAVAGEVNGTWTRALSPWLVSGMATVPAGATLTIEPGVVVVFADWDSGLDVHGTLVADGTSLAPVLFTSPAGGEDPAFWDGIYFHDDSNDADSRLTHCMIEFGGGLGAVNCDLASPRIEYCTFRRNRSAGLHARGSDPLVSGCFFTENGGFALSIGEGSFPVLADNIATGNGLRDAIFVYGGAIGRSGTWTNGGLPFVIDSELTITQFASLAVAPGVVVEASSWTQFIVEGTLVAAGTEGEPVIFTSDQPDGAKLPGQWGGFHFSRRGDTESRLEHCVIEYGGGDGGVIRLDRAAPAIRNCIISDHSNGGITVMKSNPVITGCAFLRCAGAPVTMDSMSMPELRGNYGANNLANVIDVLAGNVPPSAEWTRDGIPYRITGRVVVPANGMFRIEAGTTVQFANSQSGLDVTGDLRAIGAGSNQILFTTDDAIPAPGQWAELSFAGRHHKDNALSILEHCIVEYGGDSLPDRSLWAARRRSSTARFGTDFSMASSFFIRPRRFSIAASKTTGAMESE